MQVHLTEGFNLILLTNSPLTIDQMIFTSFWFNIICYKMVARASLNLFHIVSANINKEVHYGCIHVPIRFRCQRSWSRVRTFPKSR